MVITFEVSRPFRLRPSMCRTLLVSDDPPRRFWRYRRAVWLWFAVAYFPGDGQEYHDAMQGSEWVAETPWWVDGRRADIVPPPTYTVDLHPTDPVT